MIWLKDIKYDDGGWISDASLKVLHQRWCTRCDAPEVMHHVNKRNVGTLPPGSSVFPIYSEFFGMRCKYLYLQGLIIFLVSDIYPCTWTYLYLQGLHKWSMIIHVFLAWDISLYLNKIGDREIVGREKTIGYLSLPLQGQNTSPNLNLKFFFYL